MIIKRISIINNIKTTVTIKALNPLKRRLLITSEYVKNDNPCNQRYYKLIKHATILSLLIPLIIF